MYKHTTVKKSLFLLVAALLIVAVMLSACGAGSHKPVSKPDHIDQDKIVSNGGIAVGYGDWIYYVNGYQSSSSVENTYVNTSDAPRVGSVVRIKADKLADAVGISLEDGKTSSVKTKEISELVRKNVEIVIPRVYYSANSTTPELNGIWFFNDRIYILTPNDQLTAGGNSQTGQSVLMSYDLGGGNEQRHFTFESNSAQVWLYQNGKDVMATYVMNSKLHVLTVGANEKSSVDKLIADEDAEKQTVSSVNFDVDSGCIFYIDADGSICKLVKGETTPTVLVKNDSNNGEENTITYTIKMVSNGYVYYTKADKDNSSIDNVVLYYTKDAVTEGAGSIALNTSDVTMQGYKDGKIVMVRSRSDGFYGLDMIEQNTDGTIKTTSLLKPGYNNQSITINKIVGDDLYYTVSSVTYIKDLSETPDDTKFGTLFAYGWSMTASAGWASPDIVKVGDVQYMFTLSSGSVSVVKFNPDKKNNSSPATVLTLTVEAEK